jgi:hypothetical protein
MELKYSEPVAKDEASASPSMLIVGAGEIAMGDRSEGR